MSAANDPCEEGERIEVAAGKWFASATGLVVRFAGASHDNYADGRTELFLLLSFDTETKASEEWLPSAFAPVQSHSVHGHCVALVEGSEQRVVVRVAPLQRAEMPPVCTQPSTPRLDDYTDATEGARLHVDVRRDVTTGEWMPTPLPKMPHHHATRLTWLDLDAHPEIAATRSEVLRFEFEIAERKVQPVGEARWRAEILARIANICRVE